MTSLADYRARIEGVRFAEERVKSCARRERIGEYIPGQVIYNLGEYPARFSIRPTEYDYELIKSLSERGVGLIQLHEEWNDSQRLLGADKYTSHDPEGPHAYSEWSDIPDNVSDREKWFDYLTLYRPMVEEGTVAHIDIKESTLTRAPLPTGVHMSLFVGGECYLCVSNVGKTPATVDLCDAWIDRRSGARVNSLRLSPAQVAFLKLAHD